MKIIFEEYKIESKNFSFGFNNAYNNTTVIPALIELYKPYFNSKFFHQRCVCHVLNLYVQKGLEILQAFIKPIKDALSYLWKHPNVVKVWKAFQNTTPVFATNTKFVKLNYGSIQTTYEPISTSATQATGTLAIEATSSTSPPSAPLVFQVLMIRPVTSEKEIQIHCFEHDGTSVYTNKINGHFIWDVDPEMYDADCECRACSKPIKSPCKPTRITRDPKDPHSPWNGLL
ncbi:hypothetical protein Ddye_002639 [Dipteronia dyeriana]|uniref:DUF659 domain-containing protein n=1 Tax=Dipteronia dyeriana TaxID=168575 RepID=A0AAD9XR63_9ROSI|nr:hypothetical protein Ddye_002639 [Dipteronia dyeriana]